MRLLFTLVFLLSHLSLAAFVDEMKEMLITAGLEEECNLIDRRLQVNRGKQLKMYRVWIQCKYKKPKREES